MFQQSITKSQEKWRNLCLGGGDDELAHAKAWLLSLIAHLPTQMWFKGSPEKEAPSGLGTPLSSTSLPPNAPNPKTAPVYLVGAGPGATDLITLRALRILRSADVICYDSLVVPELLEEAKPGAELLHVGKRGYCVGSTRQEHINELLVRFAREGKTVCRLKGGDPFIFGRGGEEAEVLVANNIPFEVVPGVTAALAAAASARIPLTHRKAGQSVAFVTGHHDPESPDCTLDWSALSRLTTVVFYMAVRHIEKIAIKLCDNGMPADTPAAIIEAATTPKEKVRVAWLSSFCSSVDVEKIDGPALFIVGEPVAYRAILLGTATENASSGAEMVEPMRTALLGEFGGEQ